MKKKHIFYRTDEQEAAHTLLIEEYMELYESGRTRLEIRHIFEGRRGKTWVDRNWPGPRRGTVMKSSYEREANFQKLRELRFSGIATKDAVKEFRGLQSEAWVRENWVKIEPVRPKLLYEGMDVNPKIRLDPV